MITVPNPYQELLAAVPQGPFYDPHGTILPYSDQLYSFRLATSNPLTKYAIILNKRPVGSVTTDTSGIALVKVALSLGDNILTLSNAIIKSNLTSYITTRNWATWSAAIADVLGPLDDQALQLLTDRDLATVSFDRIDTVWGRRLRNNNRLGYTADTYRELLQVLQRAYRAHGGKTLGLMETIAAFTHVNPIIYRRNFSPQWNLGNQFVTPATMDAFSITPSSLAFINLSVNGASIKVDTTSDFKSEVGAATLAYNTTLHRFTLTMPSGISGTTDIVPASGASQVTIYAGPSAVATLWTEQGPFNTTSLTNITLEIDSHGPITITLPSSASLSTATLVSTINTALAADARYGAGYNTTASIDTLQVKLVGTTGSVVLHPSATLDASSIIFRLPASYGTTNVPIIPPASGTFTLNLVDASSMPVLDSENTFFVALGTNPRRVYEIKATNHLANSLTAYANGDIANIPFATSISVLGQLPREQQPLDVSTSVKLVLNLTHSDLLANSSDPFTLTGSILPVGWWMSNAVSNPVPSYTRKTGWMHSSCLQISLGANGTCTIMSYLNPSVTRFNGYSINAGVWAAASGSALLNLTITIGLSFNGGSTWTEQPTTITPNTWRIPTYAGVSTVIPPNAVNPLIRIKIDYPQTGVIPGSIRIEKVTCRIPTHSGRNLGQGTIPRSEHRSKRDYLCYMWAQAALTVDEKALMGLPLGIQGHIDAVSPAHASISRFEVTELQDGQLLNLVGVLDGTLLVTGTSTNMSLVMRTPSRFSYLTPTVTSYVTDETLVFPTPTAIPCPATLAHPTSQDQSSVTVYEDGIPMLDSQWSYTGPNGIQITAGIGLGKVYTIDYSILIRYETAIYQIPGNVADRVWFTDMFHLLGLNYTPQSTPVTKGIQFGATFIATLDERSDQDQSTSVLYADDGIQQVPVDTDSWEYVSSQAIRIDPTVFNPRALYYITYSARVAHPSPRPTVAFEMRQGATSSACAAATYASFSINQLVVPAAFIQFRITYGNVIDTDEVKLYSIVLKGLNTFGAGGTVPVLRNRLWSPIPKDGIP